MLRGCFKGSRLRQIRRLYSIPASKLGGEEYLYFFKLPFLRCTNLSEDQTFQTEYTRDAYAVLGDDRSLVDKAYPAPQTRPLVASAAPVNSIRGPLTSNMRFVRRQTGQNRQMRRTQRQLANFCSFELSDRVT